MQTIEAKEKPILFSAPMVRTILAGNKTQTRRIVKPQPNMLCISSFEASLDPWHKDAFEGTPAAGTGNDGERKKVWLALDNWENPIASMDWGPWQVGMRLWVKETWCRKGEDGCAVYNSEGNLDSSCVYFEADGVHITKVDGDGFTVFRKDGNEASPWISPRYMPRWASRLTLEVVGIRVQRLQDISGVDAIAEGIPLKDHSCGCQTCSMTGMLCPATQSSLIMAYATIWESINGPDSWHVNPWVWVVTFKRVD